MTSGSVFKVLFGDTDTQVKRSPKPPKTKPEENVVTLGFFINRQHAEIEAFPER